MYVERRGGEEAGMGRGRDDGGDSKEKAEGVGGWGVGFLAKREELRRCGIIWRGGRDRYTIAELKEFKPQIQQ